MSHRSVCGIFVCVVAFFAAVLGDAVVEGISNAEILWHGVYTDQSSLDLLPVFLIGTATLVMSRSLSLLQQAIRTNSLSRALILSTSRALTRREITGLLPRILALQILVLFSMETAEQIVVYGHALGGTLWLGGPIAVSLAIHTIAAVGTAFSFSSALNALGNALTRIVTCILARFVARARSTIVSPIELVFCALALIVTTSFVERGPPLLVALR